MRRILQLVSVGLAAAIAQWNASSSQQFPLARETLRPAAVGCWALFGSKGERAQGSLYWAPATTRLDSAPERPSDYEALRRFRHLERFDVAGRSMDTTGAGRRRTRSGWSADSLTDSIRLRFHTGFSGTEFVLALPDHAQHPDTLFGRAFETWDMGPSLTDRGAAHAVRQACGS
jgi:hypothetical protein